MDEQTSERRTGFLGTYFNPTAVLRLSLAAKALAWVVLVVNLSQLLFSLGASLLQILQGFWEGVGLVQAVQNILYLFNEPLQGVFYFVVLLGVSHLLLMFLDIEDNTRRAARHSDPAK